MTSRYDPEFDRAVMAAPIVDNASERLYTIGELEGDRCGCGARIPGDVDECDDCADHLDAVADWQSTGGY